MISRGDLNLGGRPKMLGGGGAMNPNDAMLNTIIHIHLYDWEDKRRWFIEEHSNNIGEKLLVSSSGKTGVK